MHQGSGRAILSTSQGNENGTRLMNNKVDAAIIGLGRWGQILVESVKDSDLIRFTAAVTRTPANVSEFCANRGIALFSDLEIILGDADIDALVVATPHSQHFDQIMAAAKAGKHIYCEKPLTLSAAEGTTALRALADENLKIAIGHNRRFSPNYLAMKRLLDEGKIGAPIHVDAHFDADLTANAGKWRDNPTESPAGGMTSLGIHALDMCIGLFGRVRSVHARSKRIASPISVDDSTLVHLDFETGCTGHLTTISATDMLWRVTVFCTGGWVEIRDQDKLEISSISDGATTKHYPGYEYPALPTIRAALESFAKDVLGGTAFPIPPAEIEHATDTLEAIIASVESSRSISVADIQNQ